MNCMNLNERTNYLMIKFDSIMITFKMKPTTFMIIMTPTTAILTIIIINHIDLALRFCLRFCDSSLIYHIYLYLAPFCASRKDADSSTCYETLTYSQFTR